MSDLCTSVHDDLKAYCDGELSLLRRNAVRRHLAGCAGCREEVHAMQMLHEGLRAGDNPETILAPALRARILAQVADIPPLPAPNRSYRVLQYGLAASLVANFAFLFLMGRYGAETFAPQPSLQTKPLSPRSAVAPPSPAASVRPEPRPRSVVPPRRPSPVATQKTLENSPGRPIVRPAPKQPRPAVIVPPVQAGSPASDSVASRPPNVIPAERQNAPLHTFAPAITGGGGAAKSTTAGTEAETPPASKTDNDVLRQDQTEARSRSVQRFAASAPPPAVMPAPMLPAPAPPPSAPTFSQAKTAAPNSAIAANGFAGGAGGFPGAVAVSGTRDKPTALHPWPVLSPPAAAGRPLHSVDADWLVDEKGQASDIHFTATGDMTVDDSIRQAIQHNHYLPALKDGKPVSARMSHTFVVNP